MSADLYWMVVYSIVIIGGLLVCLIHDHFTSRHRHPYGMHGPKRAGRR